MDKDLESMSKALIKNAAQNEQWTKIILEAASFIENEHYFYQYVIDNKYIVDFAFPIEKIVIEADGKEHRYKKNKDMKKDSYLFKNGWLVIRLNNKELLENPSYCKSLIKQIYYERREESGSR